MFHYISDPLTIIQPPENFLVRDGGTLMLTVTAQGPGHDNFTYQWKKMGTNSLPSRASGVDTKQLVIRSVTTSDKGSYYCTVTNQWGRMMESMRTAVKILGWCFPYGFVDYYSKMANFGYYSRSKIIACILTAHDTNSSSFLASKSFLRLVMRLRKSVYHFKCRGGK